MGINTGSRIAGTIYVVMIIVLLVWPEQVHSWAIFPILIAAALRAFGISGEKQQ